MTENAIAEFHIEDPDERWEFAIDEVRSFWQGLLDARGEAELRTGAELHLLFWEAGSPNRRADLLADYLAESARHSAHWDTLRLIAQKLLREGKTMPKELANWVADVLEDQTKKRQDKHRRRPGRGANRNASRDNNIALRIFEVATVYGYSPTRMKKPRKPLSNEQQDSLRNKALKQCCRRGGSSADLVGSALAGCDPPIHISYAAIEKIWHRSEYRKSYREWKKSRIRGSAD